MSTDTIHLIDQRVIETRALVPVIQAFGERIGLDAEKYRELGAAEFGQCLSCCRDEPFAQGFNPGIRFERRQTIMEGAPFCDFKFFLDT